MKILDQSKRKKQEIRENIWYKLYLLQNYIVTKDMFIGSDLRWKSIVTYAWFIRMLYQGKFNELTTKIKYTKTLVNYIRGLMDSGVEPYPAPDKQGKLVSINYLINNKILTPYQIKQIYSSVSERENLPDTSIAFTKNFNGCNKEHYNTGSYYKIVPENTFQKRDIISESDKIKKVTNPININNKLNPWKLNIQKDLNLVDVFKQFKQKAET